MLLKTTYTIACILACVAVAGCGGSEAPAEPFPLMETPDYARVDTLTPAGAGTFGAGDVEFDSRVELSPDPRSVNNRVNIDKSETQFDTITRIETNVFPPHPEEFWVEVQVYCKVNHADHATVYDTHIYVDNVEVLQFSFVGGDHLDEPVKKSFNLFEYTDGVPESALVHGKSDLTLYLDTDEATIDPENPPPAKPVAKATVAANTLRINFRN